MSNDRIRQTRNLPQETREAATAFDGACRAARALAATTAPTGRGGGQTLIDRELGGMRERVASMIDGADTLDYGIRSPYRLLVVGPSQAGKSTLINVIAEERVLPTTGVGAAKTLKETVLTYSAAGEGVLKVRYITKREANQRRFALELCARSLAPEEFIKPWPEADSDKIKGVTDHRVEEGAEDEEAAEQAHSDVKRRCEVLREQIRTVIYPEVRAVNELNALSEEDRAVLLGARPADWVDAWRLLLGQETVAGGRYADCWRPRLNALSGLLGATVEYKQSELNQPEFLRQIERHTAGGLAFVVDRVELALPSKNLEHMDVEDLPGVGNYGDPAADVARDVLARAMRDRDLDGLLVVTRQNGLDGNTANLLEEAAVLKRVLQGETDLGIAITHIDQIARQRAQDLEDAGSPEPVIENELLRRAGYEAGVAQLQRLRDLLRNESDSVDEPEQTARVDAVVARTAIVGIEASAAEAHFFELRRMRRDAFATDYKGTGVPTLIAHFLERSNDRHARRLERVVTQTERIRGSLEAELERLIRDNDVAEAQHLAAAARETYLAALKESQIPLSNRWTITREKTTMTLERGIQEVLTSAQLSAQNEATKKKGVIIRGCRTGGPGGRMIYWSTMKAALRWGGTWSGAHHLDLPGDLALSLMPELLKGWRTLVANVETLLTQYGDGASQLLDDLEGSETSAAAAAGVAANAAAVVDARTQLQVSLEAALSVLRASVDEQNERVQQRLREVLKGHFEVECQNVLKLHPHGRQYPQGYTNALLEAYDDIGASAIVTGADAGTTVLRKALNSLVAKIKKRLFDQDPIAIAYSRLIGAVHDIAEAPDVVDARSALVEWAHKRKAWLMEQFVEREWLFDKYRILTDIPVGGMSRGYKVEDKERRICFLKVVEKHSFNERALKRELEIYDRLCRKRIEGVLELLDWGETEGEAYIVLPWADGGTLDSIVPNGGMDPEDVVRHGLWLSQVVARLHAEDIVHRDIKPQNLLKSGGGWVLGDFGLAKNLKRYDDKETVRGSASPGYAPPEQVRGSEPHPSMDVYAIGKLLCFLGTGQTDRDRAFGVAGFTGTNVYKLMMACTQDTAGDRPDIGEVVRRLSNA